MNRKTGVPIFGAVGTKLIEYTGDLSGVFGPFVTKKIYRFRPGKNPRLVDLRDLSSLAQVAGRENLRDVNAVPESKRPKRVREPRQEPAGVPVEQEEANDATE